MTTGYFKIITDQGGIPWKGMMDDVWVADVDDGAHSTYFPNAMSPTPDRPNLRQTRKRTESKMPSL